MVTRTTSHVPVPASALPDFDPVPRKCPRHDGWTPERQRGFIAALADTGCVKVAARMVNMAHASAYQLRREPGAESFRRAWDAAQSLGLQVVKDEAFDRALNGQLVPVFTGGKLMGFRRKKNDALLMFILRHYGQDSNGRKTTINYFSTRATAAAGAVGAPSGRQPTRSGALTSARDAEPCRPTTGEAVSIDVTNSVRDGAPALAAAEASTTTVKTVISGNSAPSQLASDDEAAALLDAFEGVQLDAEASAEIQRALAACAERRRSLETDWSTPHDEKLRRQAENDECDFIRVAPGSVEYLGELESGAGCEEFVPFNEGEPPWEQIGAPVPEYYSDWEQRQAQAEAAKALPPPDSPPPSVRPEPAEARPPASAKPLPEPPSPQSQIPNPQTAEATPDPACPGPRSGDPGPRETRKRSLEPGRRTYKPRKPKAPFTPPDKAAEAEAVAEAARRKRRRREAKGE